MKAAIAIALLGLAPSAALAAPASVKLSWASVDASTTIAVSWVTSNADETMIQYGRSGTGENMLTGSLPSEVPGIGWVHEIELSGLSPNTMYRYRVGSPGDFSPEYTFKTAPADACTPFTFVQLGDARSQNDRGPSQNWTSIHQEAMAAGAAFILNGGDLVKDGSEITQWAQWLSDSEMVNPVVPMMPAIGNHDDGPGDGNSAHYNKLFVLPSNSVTGTEDYYYFIYNNALFFSLSTQTFDDWQAQMAWLSDIAARHPTKWKFAYFHHPVYTTQTTLILDVGHPPNEKGQNPFYGPAFDAAGIDVVFQSHNHIYERFRPLRYDPQTPEEGREVPTYGNGPSDGRLYVVSGGAGAFLDPLIEGQFVSFARGSQARSKDHHFMKVSIAGNTLHYSAIRTTAGNTSGGGTIIDELTLTRPGPDPCSQPADPDRDADGYASSRDCDDADPAINPGVAEICGNSLDEDCSGLAERCPAPPVDGDNDGSPLGTDCDDGDRNRYPEKAEVDCDGTDNNCDCFEVCGAMRIDACGNVEDAPDAGSEGMEEPVATQEDPRSGAADAREMSPDAGAAPSPPLGTPPESCGCTETGLGDLEQARFILLLLILLGVLRLHRLRR